MSSVMSSGSFSQIKIDLRLLMYIKKSILKLYRNEIYLRKKTIFLHLREKREKKRTQYIFCLVIC